MPSIYFLYEMSTAVIPPLVFKDTPRKRTLAAKSLFIIVAKNKLNFNLQFLKGISLQLAWLAFQNFERQFQGQIYILSNCGIYGLFDSETCNINPKYQYYFL